MILCYVITREMTWHEFEFWPYDLEMLISGVGTDLATLNPSPNGYTTHVLFRLGRILYSCTRSPSLPSLPVPHLSPRAGNEAKHHPQMATHPSLLTFYYPPQVTIMSETFHPHHNYGIKSPDQTSFRLSMAKHSQAFIYNRYIFISGQHIKPMVHR